MKLFLSLLKLLVLVLIILVLPIYFYLEYPELIKQFSTMEGVNHFLDQYKTASIFVYIGLQISQIVISIIPGQFIQFAGGYAYSFWFGYLYSIIGIGIGTAISFLLARVLGRDALHFLFGEQKISKFVNQLNSKRAFSILFVLFVIPGIPKDLITYAAGISEFRFFPYFVLSMIGRSPALMGTIMMGSMLNKGSYFGLITLTLLAIILCISLYIKRHEITVTVDRIYTRFLKPNS
jgi:uncharacterized membrane protein YdjX (TVP38/TMEM64 family)